MLLLTKGGNFMPLIECPNCKKPVSDGADVCIHCGYDLKAMQASTPDTFFALPQDEQDKLKQEFNSNHKKIAKKCNNDKPPISIIVVYFLDLILLWYGFSPIIAIRFIDIDSGIDLITNIYLISAVICWVVAIVISIIVTIKFKKFKKNSLNYKIHFEKWLMEEKNLNITWDLNKKDYAHYEQMKRSINQ